MVAKNVLKNLGDGVERWTGGNRFKANLSAVQKIFTLKSFSNPNFPRNPELMGDPKTKFL